MKKETADKLAYEFALACGANSVHKLDANSAKGVADFIQGLSQSFQQNLSDFQDSEQFADSYSELEIPYQGD